MQPPPRAQAPVDRIDKDPQKKQKLRVQGQKAFRTAERRLCAASVAAAVTRSVSAVRNAADTCADKQQARQH